MTSVRRKSSSKASQRSTTALSCPNTDHQRPPRPHCCDTTMANVCNGVMLTNSWLIWKVRTKPRRTRWCGASWLMSCPSSSMRPDVGVSTPVSRLISVVLPAPLGPIKAWRAPRRRSRFTLSVAVMPPNCLTRPWAFNTTGGFMDAFIAHHPSHPQRGQTTARGGSGVRARP